MINKIFFWKKIGVGIIIFINVLAIIALFSSSAKGESSNEIELNLSFTEPVITQWNVSNVTYHNVTMNETGTIGSVGLPILPVKQLRILLPQKGIVKSINITHSNEISLGNGYNVTPGGLLTNQSEEQQNPYNETLFNPNKSYPKQLFKDLGISNFRGYTIFICHLYPVQYIKDTGEIYYYEYMNLTITTNNSGSVSRFFSGLEEDEILMEQSVDDYCMNYTYNSTLGPTANTTVIKQGNKFAFVIITSEKFVDADRPFGYVGEWYNFTKFKKYKNDEADLTTEIKTIEEIIAEPAYHGTGEWGDGPDFDDTACRIRNFIKHAVSECDVKYVLLGGDVSYKGEKLIPARKLWCKFPEDVFGKEKYYDIVFPSDLYYACLEGSFNEDKDDRWGEPFDGAESGDFEDPPHRGDPRINEFYAEADIQQYKTEFEVGLVTPSFDLSSYEDVNLKLESNNFEGDWNSDVIVK